MSTNKTKNESPRGASGRRSILPWVMISLAGLMLLSSSLPLSVKTISYSDFKSHLAKGEVVECRVAPDEIAGRIVPKDAGSEAAGTSESEADRVVANSDANGTSEADTELSAEPAKVKGFLFRTVRVEDSKLVEQLQGADVDFAGTKPSSLFSFILGWVLPIGLIVLLWIFLSRRIGAARETVMNIGKSKAKLVADQETGVDFKDVAGCDEAKFELQEVVDFLRNPKRYEVLGARIPQGVLLVGPPGTGKTLIARAVAGEAKVPFFSLSGSEFVEMFVGVGAARVRNLFEEAKKKAPCIVFIDELDAVGRQRGVQVGAVNDEREQTLNQLLVEMDGFEENSGVILIAATNRPEVLDRALLRPGRFDRQVVVDAPDVDGREEILKVHARGKKLAADTNLRRVAQATPGFSGADLANALNEAALLSARRSSREITQRDLEDAVEKVVAGPERKSRRLDKREKRRVAYHEAGHALVAAFSEHADPVHKISIVPRGRAALGYTLQLPTEDQFLLTRSELLDRIKGLLGGRAAEEVVFGEVSTGAENDIERATALAQHMVCAYGMGESLGLAHRAEKGGMFLAGPEATLDLRRNFSEETARKIDREVENILANAYDETKRRLSDNRATLERVTRELLIQETLDAATFQALIQTDEASTTLAASTSGQPEGGSRNR